MVSLADLIADTLVKIVWICLCILRENYGGSIGHIWQARSDGQRDESSEQPYVPIPGDPNYNSNGSSGAGHKDSDYDTPYSTDATTTYRSTLSWYFLATGFIVFIALCIFTTTHVFMEQIL